MKHLTAQEREARYRRMLENKRQVDEYLRLYIKVAKAVDNDRRAC